MQASATIAINRLKMDLVKKLSIMFIIVICIWITEYLTRAQCNELDECCYSYASVPRNDTFCIPNGEQALLHCVIINPDDNFTNLTVMWFRSTTEDMSEFDKIPSTSNSEEYRFINFVSGSIDNSLSLINCSHKLHRDTFLLAILRFTQHKNGYYWCQLSINNTLVQPSHRVQFSAGNCSITNQPYYRLASLRLGENRCAKYVTTESDTGLTTTHELSGTSFVVSISSTESSTRLSTGTQQERERATYAATESDAGVTTTYKVTVSDSSVTSLTESTRNVTTESDAGLTTRSSSVTQQEEESDRSIIYVAETFSALLLIALMGVLVLALSFASYVHYQRKKTKHQCEVTAELENQEYDDISTGRTQSTATEGEVHVYQTLNLNEMNYESMYAKIMPTKLKK